MINSGEYHYAARQLEMLARKRRYDAEKREDHGDLHALCAAASVLERVACELRYKAISLEEAWITKT